MAISNISLLEAELQGRKSVSPSLSPSMQSADRLDLSILILTKNEQENIGQLLPAIWKVIRDIGVQAEIVLIDASSDRTPQIGEAMGCRVIRQKQRGYGQAFRQGLEAVRGDYVITVDADHSHEPEFLYHMWAVKDSADVIIGSRYICTGSAVMPWSRRILSRLLNRVFSFTLALPYKDLSSGYRLYRREVIESSLPLKGRDFDVLEEILVKAHCEGWRIHEVPIHYRPRHQGRSNANAVKFALSYLRTLKSLWSLRNGANACDYDSRAFNSLIIPQRYWQRRRFEIITQLLKDYGRCLDIGCGASRIIQSLPAMVGMDVNRSKLRFLKTSNPYLVGGSAYQLPFADTSFDAVLCSEVIEHIPKSNELLTEMRRVLKPGGTLILGTPDYASRLWNFIEYWYGKLMPSAYADEHISHYTRGELEKWLVEQEFDIVSVHYIVKSELIIEARRIRPDASAASAAN